jgi:magnesium transporter
MLVNCVAYREGVRLGDVPVAEAHRYLGQPGHLVWVGLKDPAPGELADLRHRFDLHPLAAQDACREHERPKLVEYDDDVFVVMQLVRAASEGVLGHSQLAVLAGPGYVITVRGGTKESFEGVLERCEREPQLLGLGSGYVLYALMDDVVDRYVPILERLQADLESIDEHIFAPGAARANLQRLYGLKRKALVLEHAVGSMLQFAGKFQGGRVPVVCQGLQAYFRDTVEHLARIEAALNTIREAVATAITVNLSLVTIEEGEVTKRLAAWAAIFAVATAFAGIWGMNFEHMPELKLPWGYPAALTLILGTGIYLWWRFRRAGWL